MPYGQVRSYQCFEGICASIFDVEERTGLKKIPLSLTDRNMFKFKILLQTFQETLIFGSDTL